MQRGSAAHGRGPPSWRLGGDGGSPGVPWEQVTAGTGAPRGAGTGDKAPLCEGHLRLAGGDLGFLLGQ